MQVHSRKIISDEPLVIEKTRRKVEVKKEEEDITTYEYYLVDSYRFQLHCSDQTAYVQFSKDEHDLVVIACYASKNIILRNFKEHIVNILI